MWGRDAKFEVKERVVTKKLLRVLGAVRERVHYRRSECSKWALGANGASHGEGERVGAARMASLDGRWNAAP